MKSIFAATLAIGLAAAALGVDLSAPVPVMRLPDGRVLRGATFTKYGPELVTIRSNLGPLSVRYELLPDDIRAEAERHRPGGPRWFAGDTSGNTQTINGQIFVQTVGAGAYKFGNVDVYAIDLAALSNFSQPGKVKLPRPIHMTTTDADGKFALRVPIDRPYFIFAQASRLVETVRLYQWQIPMSDVRAGKPLALTQDNKSPVRRVEIEQQP